MRQARLMPDKSEGEVVAHCLSRCEWVFKVQDRQDPACLKFVEMLRKQEEFTGVRVLTYTLMSNHFHLLLEQPRDTGGLFREMCVIGWPQLCVRASRNPA